MFATSLSLAGGTSNAWRTLAPQTACEYWGIRGSLGQRRGGRTLWTCAAWSQGGGHSGHWRTPAALEKSPARCQLGWAHPRQKCRSRHCCGAARTESCGDRHYDHVEEYTVTRITVRKTAQSQTEWSNSRFYLCRIMHNKLIVSVHFLVERDEPVIGKRNLSLTRVS